MKVALPSSTCVRLECGGTVSFMNTRSAGENLRATRGPVFPFHDVSILPTDACRLGESFRFTSETMDDAEFFPDMML